MGACAGTRVSHLGVSHPTEARPPATELCAPEAFMANPSKPSKPSNPPNPAQPGARNRSDEVPRRHPRLMHARRAVHAAHVVRAVGKT
jgi:hypothetical protein